jgi:nitrogenase-associated protein
MTHIVFYEKPGCGGNAKQRAALEAAGHTLTRRSLLDAGWTSGTLMPYLAELPVPQWFNRAAPRVKSGEIVPEALNADAALALLLAEPLLIRRPLMQRPDGARLVASRPMRSTASWAWPPWSQVPPPPTALHRSKAARPSRPLAPAAEPISPSVFLNPPHAPEGAPHGPRLQNHDAQPGRPHGRRAKRRW